MKKIKVMVLVFMLAAIFSGCNNSTPDNDMLKEETSQTIGIDSRYGGEKISEDEIRAIQNECEKMLPLYKDIYEKAEKYPSSDWSDKTVISQDAIDTIESVLMKAGYPVINSDEVYPEYLENSDGILEFWDAVREGKDAKTVFWEVSSSGELYYNSLQYEDGKAISIFASTSWNKQGNLELNNGLKRDIINWNTNYNGDFYYQDVPTTTGWEAAKLLRLKPVDKERYDLNARYIMPVGYHNVNLFLCDWDTSDYGDLCFNDLFEWLYKLKHNDYVYARDYAQEDEPYYHCCIPSDVFENTILPYFDIPLSEFREKALYDSTKDIYPWQELNCSNIAYYPTVIPEITEAIKNKDGSITLKVNVMCLDNKTDCLFTHEVTVMPSDNGGFKYLGNKITYKSQIELPSCEPRIPTQRTVKDQESE